MAAALAAWAEQDATRALHPADRAAISSTAATRSLVLELFASGAPARDLFNACARLGSLLAEAGASPSLVAGAIDSAVNALAGSSYDASRVAPARSALLEGYVAAARDAERISARQLWNYPMCAVRLPDGAVAIACGHPSDDRDALSAWAANVASRLVKEKVRRAVLSGEGAAKSELASALELVGIEPSAAEEPRQKTSWLRLPWKKS